MRRLLAMEQLFKSHSEWRDRVHVIQILVPTREKVARLFLPFFLFVPIELFLLFFFKKKK